MYHKTKPNQTKSDMLAQKGNKLAVKMTSHVKK